MQHNHLTHLIEQYLNESNTLYMFHIALGIKTSVPIWLMNNASWFGHVAVLNWCKESKLEMRWNTDAIDLASENGHIAVLDWWKDSGLNMKWSYRAMDYASNNEHVEVLKWWKDSGLEMRWTWIPLYFAVQESHIAVQEWWKESGLIEKDSIEIDCLDRTMQRYIVNLYKP